MTTETTMDKSEAASLVRDLLQNDYFQSFHDYDRVYDPDGLYKVETTTTTMNDDDEEDFTWSEEEREALSVFADMTPEERAFGLDYTLDSKGRPVIEFANGSFAIDSKGQKVEAARHDFGAPEPLEPEGSPKRRL